ncbi:hypothetical protein B0H17DRAFT_1130348 [Mycena rosella]|uniref:Uncharacterized protein n=1 Tax=Mycena rosella TaxID=1033263 RepID=A0AAD7GJ26_MYCRO|nr:hypothetical protein B0H17DRAFT_1130348 [Mycena rosella]
MYGGAPLHAYARACTVPACSASHSRAGACTAGLQRGAAPPFGALQMRGSRSVATAHGRGEFRRARPPVARWCTHTCARRAYRALRRRSGHYSRAHSTRRLFGRSDDRKESGKSGE